MTDLFCKQVLLDPKQEQTLKAGAPLRTLKLNKYFSELAAIAAHMAARASTFIVASLIILVWAISGPYFGFSDTWQLVINTGTTVITFLMVFLIQNTQYRDSVSIQVKLDELIRSSKAQNAFVGIEHLTDEEIVKLREECEARAIKEGLTYTHHRRNHRLL